MEPIDAAVASAVRLGIGSQLPRLAPGGNGIFSDEVPIPWPRLRPAHFR